MTRLAINLGALALTVSALTACSSDTTEPARQPWQPSGASDAGSDAGSEPSLDGALPSDVPTPGTGAELAVRLEASAEALCPGECATLEVRVAGAPPTQSAHTLAWTDSAEARAATREVCPTSSTTYRVEVREQLEAIGEFTPEARSGSADLTLSVLRDCDEDDAGTPPPEDEGCSYRIPIAWPNQGIVHFSGPVKQDAQGNLYLAAGFTGKVSIGGKVFGKDSLFASGNTDVLLAKFDSTCKLLWAKQLESDGQFTTLYNFTVGLDGSMALVTQDMSYDFFFNQEVHQHIYVLDAQGNPKWDRFGGAYAAHTPQTFDFGADGALAVHGVGVCSDTYQDCVGVFEPDGSLRHGISVGRQTSVGVAFDPAGNLVIAGLGRVQYNDYYAYAQLYDAAATQRWARQVPAIQDQVTTIEARAIFADNGDVLSPRMYVDPQGQHLHVWRTDAQGNTLEDADHVQPPEAGWVNYLWPMLDGTYAVLATRPLPDATDSDQFAEQVLLQRREANGSVLFERDVSVGKYSAPGGAVVPGPDGALGFTVIEMQEHNDVTASRGRTTALVVRRLVPGE